MHEQLNIEHVPISEPKPAAYNPRTIDQKEFAGLVESIKTFGLVDPIIINKDGTVIGGHMRLEAAKKIGYEQVPVVRLNLNKKAERKLNVVLNSQAISGRYDELKLAELLNEFKLDKDYEALRLDKLEPLDLSDEPPKGSLADRFVMPPFSVLNTVAGEWQERKRLWLAKIEDKGESRQGTLSKGDNYIGEINDGVSILDPVLAELMVRWFGLSGGVAFDCFAGDSVFGYVAAAQGMSFVGIELRQEQAELNQQRVDKDKLPAKYICDDALNMDKHIKDGTVDLFFSCPPYADLEVYSDLPNDLSNMSHDDFFKVYATALANTYAKLKPNRFAVVVTSEVRNKKGEYISLVPKTVELMQAAGYTYYNELILVNAVGTLPRRVGRFMRHRKIGRRHQNVLVFYKGNIKAIKDEYPELEIDTEVDDESTDI